MRHTLCYIGIFCALLAFAAAAIQDGMKSAASDITNEREAPKDDSPVVDRTPEDQEINFTAGITKESIKRALKLVRKDGTDEMVPVKLYSMYCGGAVCYPLDYIRRYLKKDMSCHNKLGNGTWKFQELVMSTKDGGEATALQFEVVDEAKGIVKIHTMKRVWSKVDQDYVWKKGPLLWFNENKAIIDPALNGAYKWFSDSCLLYKPGKGEGIIMALNEISDGIELDESHSHFQVTEKKGRLGLKPVKADSFACMMVRGPYYDSVEAGCKSLDDDQYKTLFCVDNPERKNANVPCECQAKKCDSW